MEADQEPEDSGALSGTGPVGTDLGARDAIAGPVGVATGFAGTEPVAATGVAFDEGSAHEEIPWRIIWSAIGVVLAAAAAIELVLALKTVIELFVIAGFLAVVLSPAVSALVRIKLRRSLATTIVFLLGMAAFGGLGYLFIHPLYQEAIHFANDLPGNAGPGAVGQGPHRQPGGPLPPAEGCCDLHPQDPQLPKPPRGPRPQRSPHRPVGPRRPGPAVRS